MDKTSDYLWILLVRAGLYTEIPRQLVIVVNICADLLPLLLESYLLLLLQGLGQWCVISCQAEVHHQDGVCEGKHDVSSSSSKRIELVANTGNGCEWVFKVGIVIVVAWSKTDLSFRLYREREKKKVCP